MMHINSNLLWCYSIITFKVRAMFRIADDKAFCILVRISLALPLTSLRTFPFRYLDHPPSAPLLYYIAALRIPGTAAWLSSQTSVLQGLLFAFLLRFPVHGQLFSDVMPCLVLQSVMRASSLFVLTS